MKLFVKNIHQTPRDDNQVLQGRASVVMLSVYAVLFVAWILVFELPK